MPKENPGLISVIIPVYNAEKYLQQCIGSVIKQTYGEIELLMIDDGSTDNSARICGAYASGDKRAKFIRTQNRGPAAARNRGIEEATGEFIFFLDADDSIEENSLELLAGYYGRHNPDLVVGNANSINGNMIGPGYKGVFAESKVLTRQDIIDYARRYLGKPNKFTLFAYSWGRLFRSSIIKKHNIRFDERLHTYEDVDFNFVYFRHAEKTFFLNEPVYNHLIHDNYMSATMAVSGDPRALLGYQEALLSVKRFLSENSPGTDAERETGNALITLTIIQLVRACGQVDRKNKGKIFRLIREIVNDRNIRDNLKFYAPSKGESRWIPFFIRLKFSWPIMRLCRYKAGKRYGSPAGSLTINKANNRKTIENIKGQKAPVIIFGAGVAGDALYLACVKTGIKVECFCDNNAGKTGHPLCGREVMHTPDLKNRYPDAAFLISAADIKDVVDQLRSLGFAKWYPGSLLLRDLDVYKHQFSAPAEFVEYAVATCILCQDNYLNPEKLFLRSVDVIITERCSLKCRDCSNLMQYYKKPADCDTQGLLRSIDDFCAAVDEINEFRVIGGEPFMNKDLHLILKRLTEEPKVMKVVIYTNGTILPAEKQMEYLKSEKILFIITDYGPLSRNLGALTKSLTKNHIAYYAQKAGGWSECSEIRRRARAEEDQRELFRSCCAKNTLTLSNGKLYRCPFSANADRLRAIPDFPEDYVTVSRGPGKPEDLLEIKMRIKRLMLEKPFLMACDYCNGRPFTAPEITPALQAAGPLEYEVCRR
ncbi:MAG: glycosyltransferase [Candidatus Omnitrophota bacterium]